MAYLTHGFGSYMGEQLEEHAEDMTTYARAFAEAAVDSSPRDYLRSLEVAGQMYSTLGPLLERYNVLVCPTTGLPAVEEILGDLQRDPNLIMAVVLDQDGELLASVGELQDPRLEARLTAESAVVYEGGIEDEALGRVRVAFHRDELICHLEERLVADSEALQSLLGRLREMLEGYDPEAADVLDEIRGYGIPGASETMGVLGRCVADYDFEAALEQMVCLEKAVAHAGYEESR